VSDDVTGKNAVSYHKTIESDQAVKNDGQHVTSLTEGIQEGNIVKLFYFLFLFLQREG
jgi:hypothetical protein